MFVLPSHCDLKDIVQVSNAAVTVDQKASPNHGADVLKNDFNLEDTGSGSFDHAIKLPNELSSFPPLFSTLLDEAYYKLLSNEENIGTVEIAVDQARETLRPADLRLANCVGTQLEVLETQTNLVERQNHNHTTPFYLEKAVQNGSYQCSVS